MKEFNELTQNIITSIENKNGKDIQVIDLEGLSIIADNFIIASATNERQVGAIAEEVKQQASKLGYDLRNMEGRQSGRWVLLDFGDSVVHIFHEDERAFYNLERLWKDDNNISYIN